MDWLYHLRSKHKTQQEAIIKSILEQKEIEKQEVEKMVKVKAIENVLSRTANTPDIANLSNKIGAIIFVYNDLMFKRRDHELLEPLAFCGNAYTTNEMNGWYRKKDALPIVMYPQILSHIPSWGIQKNAHAAVLKGEVYVIKADKLFELDLYHENGVQFIRQRIDIHIPYGEEIETKDKIVIKSEGYHQHLKAWVYVGNPNYWWGETDKEGLGFARAVPYDDTWKNGSDHYINNLDFTPMPIHTPKKTWRQLYYYHDPRNIK